MTPTQADDRPAARADRACSCLVLIVPMMAMGKSPHVRYDPSEIDVTLDDVVGLGPVNDEVVKTLNLFLGYQTFREHMGGNPRKAILFEGPPGTGKTYMAKAMAREAGVPFLFVSSTAFQSMYYGADRPQDPQLLQGAAQGRAAKKAARSASSRRSTRSPARAAACAARRSTTFAATARRHGRAQHTSEGISGVVNELLIQLQSFDHADGGGRMHAGWSIDAVNRLLPAHRRIEEEAAGVRRTSS